MILEVVLMFVLIEVCFLTKRLLNATSPIKESLLGGMVEWNILEEVDLGFASFHCLIAEDTQDCSKLAKPT